MGEKVVIDGRKVDSSVSMQAIEEGLGDADFSAVKETLKPKA